jgi:hypothetical protein
MKEMAAQIGEAVGGAFEGDALAYLVFVVEVEHLTQQPRAALRPRGIPDIASRQSDLSGGSRSDCGDPTALKLDFSLACITAIAAREREVGEQLGELSARVLGRHALPNQLPLAVASLGFLQ